MDSLNLLGAAVVAILGLLGLIAPRAAADFVRLAPLDSTGTSEIRATYGGIFLGLGLVALYSRTSEVFLALGVGFALAAAARLVSVWLDDSRKTYNFVGIVFEGAIALLLLV